MNWRYAPEGAKRRYEAHFLSKLTDCDGEANETDSSLDFARDCGYISHDEHKRLTSACTNVGRMLGKMMQKSKSFLRSEIDSSTATSFSDVCPPTSATDHQLLTADL
jgi:hypothetical protein